MKKRIFVVDDDSSIRDYLFTFLSISGYYVECFENGQQMLNRLASNGAPGLLLLDVLMPGSDGIELLEKVRASGSTVPVIMLSGASHIRTSPYQTGRFVKGRTEFTGVDLRWMQWGVQLRGEWLTGRPFDGTTTTGWYADAIVHCAPMGPVTAVGRVERLDYDVRHPFDLHTRRQTIGMRVRVVEGLSAQINVLRQTGQPAGYKPEAHLFDEEVVDIKPYWFTAI